VSFAGLPDGRVAESLMILNHPTSGRCGRHHALALLRNLLHCFQDRLTRKGDVFAPVGEPPLPVDSLLIYQEERALGIRLARGQNAVSPNHFEVRKIAEQRIGQLERLRKRFLREEVISADAEKLDVQVLERAKIGLSGREVGHSHRCEIDAIKLEEDKFLSTELA